VLLEHWLIDRKPSSGVHERNVDNLENRPLSITESEPGEQPETSTTKLLIAWIPYLREWRDVFECDHGRYYCLDPGDGLPTHINDGDGIEVIETTEAECNAAMNAWGAAHFAAARDSIDIDMPGVGVVSARGDGSPVSCAPGGEGAAGQELPRHPAGGVQLTEKRCKCGSRFFTSDGVHCAACGSLSATNQDLNAKEAATDETLAAGDAIRPLEFSDVVSGAQFTELIGALSEVVRKAHPTSALIALKVTACAFGVLLDIYAAPNAENPEGMCDDLDAFRNVFAQIIAGGAL